jgi:RHS repeat-associated protein
VYYPWTTANGQGRLQQLKAGTLTPNDPTSLQNVQYTYDAVGNVLTILDNKAGPQTQTFHYDSLDRLADATASGGTGGTYPLETYTYNPIGNLTSKAGVAQWYSDTLHPHAVTHLNGVQKFWYDANGNMVTRNDSTGSFTQQWDKENRLITVTGTASGSFVYDGDGNRVKATLNGTTTAYIGNYYEQTGAAIKKYYYAGGTRIAVNDNGTLYWLLGDHLGSTAITANSGGGKYAELRYTPWGEERYTNGVTTPTRRQYTGQINDSEIGLYFYNARSYSSVLGRFISADTIVPDVSDPQSWNRFSYTRNNPINRIDPSGHADALPDDGGVSIKTLIEMVEKAKNGYMASGAPMPSWDSLQRETQKGLSLSSAGWSKTSWNLEFGHCDRSCPDVWAHHDLFGEPINAAIWTLGGMYFFARVAAGAAVLEEGGIGALSGGPSGALSIEGNLSAYSSSEIGAARYLANLGDDVVLRSASNIKRTSDLLVNGVAYDVYTPQTSNVARIVSAIAKKNSQAQGIIVDLSQTALNPGDLGNLLARVRGAGATNITDIIIMPK